MQRAPFAPVESEGAESFEPGQEATRWTPGDFILTHGDSFYSRLIRFGQRLRIHGEDRKYTYWNHAAMIVGDKGELIEALGKGVVRTHASRYREREYTVVNIVASTEDRTEAVAFAESAADRLSGYGWITIVSVSLTLLTGGKFNFFIDGQFICSGLVAQCLERTNAIFNRDASHMMPADLAKYFQVEIPSYITSHRSAL
jgi:uncharacterized protein YycO